MNAGLPQKLQAVTVQHIGAETLVYDEARHQAFCLNPTSATVWNLADGTRTPAQIAAAATLALAAPVSEPLVLFTLAELRRDGLLAPKSLAAVPPQVSRRAVIQSLGTGSVLLLPVVAAIFAPKAAQAYGGCFDCSNTVRSQRKQARIDAIEKDAAKNKQRNEDPYGLKSSK